MKQLFFIIAISFSINLNAQSNFFAFNKDSEFFYKIDTNSQFNFLPLVTDTLFSSIGNVNGVLGADTDPCGNVFLVYNSIQGRNLAKADLNTGILTDIGTLSVDGVANICFDNNGTLYAVTGDGSTIGETLFTVDTSNASMSQVLTLGNGLDGESIEYNPDDNYMYHWSGWGSSNFIMEKINLLNLSITPITFSGPGATLIENVGASTYAGNGEFIVYDISQGLHFMIDTNGHVSNPLDTVGQYNYSIKGLIFPKNIYINTNSQLNPSHDTICFNDTITVTISNFDTTAVSSFQWYINGSLVSNLSSSPAVFQYIPTVGYYYIHCIANMTCSNQLSSNTLFYTVHNIPNVNINPSAASFCSGDSVILNGSPGGSSQWFIFNQSSQVYDSINGAVSNSYYVSSPGIYNMQKTNSNGCSALSANPITVTENPIPSVTISASVSDTLCLYDAACSITSNPTGATFTGNGISSNPSGGANFDPSIAGMGSHVIVASYTDSNGCVGADSLTMYVDGCASINSTHFSEIQIIPNPNNGNFCIKGLSQNQFFIISNIQGKKIQTDFTKNLTETTISGLNKGIYFLIFENSIHKKSMRFIVE